MSDSPRLSDKTDEIQAVFPSDDALQDAIGRLTQMGFDRADLSLPAAAPRSGENTPDQGAADPNTDTDSRQLRTMGAGISASAGAMAAAGAVIAATGGAAAPVIGAALAGGVVFGGASELVHHGADAEQKAARDHAAAEGRLVLAVNLRDPAREAEAAQAMEQAGATRVVAVTRGAAVNSAGWTG